MIIGGVAGLVVAAAMMSVAWQHNPQGEIHDQLRIDSEYWILTGASWFALTAMAIGLASGVLLWVTLRVRSRAGG